MSMLSAWVNPEFVGSMNVVVQTESDLCLLCSCSPVLILLTCTVQSDLASQQRRCNDFAEGLTELQESKNHRKKMFKKILILVTFESGV